MLRYEPPVSRFVVMGKKFVKWPVLTKQIHEETTFFEKEKKNQHL